ncbi:acyltransferase [Desulfovibrio sp.]|uniref:acyltransferase n=1 Tax=Desulfovibrio sp. TaxID=885 RepID=UPI003D13C251
MNMLQKALNRGLTPANIISYASLQVMTRWGRFFGTLRLRCKAALLGVPVGSGVTAHGPVGLMRWPGSHITIGAGTSLISSWRRATAAALATPVRLRTFGPGARIDIGPGAQLSGTSIAARSTTISIGRQVLIAPNCIIVDSDFHAHWPPEARATEPGMEGDRPVTIGDYAWIGLNCIILKGVAIGEGAIIGAGSVVTKDVPPHTLAVGSPARVVRSLVPGQDRAAAARSASHATDAGQSEAAQFQAAQSQAPLAGVAQSQTGQSQAAQSEAPHAGNAQAADPATLAPQSQGAPSEAPQGGFGQ